MNVQIFVSAETHPDEPSRVVAWWMKRWFSHIGIIYNGVIYHHTGKGFWDCDLEEFKCHHKIKCIDITDRITVSEDAVKYYLKGRLGVGYSRGQLAAILLPWLRKWFRNGSQKAICSESVAEFYNTCVGHTFDDTDFLAPDQVWDFINSIRPQSRT